MVCGIVRSSAVIGLHRIATETWSSLSTVAQGTLSFAVFVDDCLCCMSLLFASNGKGYR